MALQDQVIPVSFGKGVNTKSDPKALEGQLIQLQDGVFGLTNNVQKRNGYTNLLAFTSLLTKSFANQLLLADGQNLYSYASDTKVLSNIGTYTSVSVNPSNIPITNPSATHIRTAYYTTTSGSFTCTTYANGDPVTGLSSLYVNITETYTGNIILADTAFYTSSSPSAYLGYAQPFVINNNTVPTFGIVYKDVAQNLLYGSISIVANVPTMSFGTVLVNTASTVSFNVLNSGGNVSYVSYALTNGSITDLNVSTLVGGAFTNTVTSANTTYSNDLCEFLQSCFDTNGNIWTAIAAQDSGNTNVAIQYFVVSPALSVVRALSTLTTYTPVDSQDPSTIGLSPQVGGTVKIYYGKKTLDGTERTPGAFYFITTYVSTLSTTLSPTSPVIFIQNLELASQWVTYSGNNYAVFGNVYPSLAAYIPSGLVLSPGEQNTYFLICEATATAVAKCLSGEAIPITLDYIESIPDTGAEPIRNNLYNLQVFGNSIYFGASNISQLSDQVFNSNPKLFSNFVFTAKLEQFNFADPQAYQSTVFQNTALFNGGIVKGFDGQTINESGFLLYPDLLFAEPITSGGNISTGTYGYAATYTWVDANNQLYESFPLEISVIMPTTTTGKVILNFQTLGLTEKGLTGGHPVYINLYRTDVNGTIFYLLAQLKNDPTVPQLTFGDEYGVSLAGQPELYTTGNVLPNDPPPASMILTAREQRLYAVDSENPNTDYWYTKSQNKGFGVNFSGFLVETIDTIGGAITSQVQMDEKLVTLKGATLGYQVGDGPNDTGDPASSSLSNFQFVPTDTGSDNHKATILIPDGVVYQSNKGIYILNRGLQVAYFGPEVQQYNGQFISGSTMLGNVNQVRFLTNSGLTLVYNYFFHQWSTFTNHQGTSADIYNGVYTYSRTDGHIYAENSTTFLDDTVSYAPLMQLYWLKFGSIQGFQRIKQLLLLGDQTSPSSGHGVQISAAYDFNQSSFNTPIPFIFSSSGSETPFQYREFLAQQKCDSLSLIIQEITTGASGEYIDFTDLTLLAGVKKGFNKLSAANSVG